MKRRILSMLIAVLFCFELLPLTISAAENSEWDGISKSEPVKEGDIYFISTPDELAWLAEYVNEGGGASADALLTSDINLGHNEWSPIGNAEFRYRSNFDGQGHIVSGLLVNNAENGGLFGYAQGAVIQGITVRGDVSAVTAAGGILGSSGGECTIMNCGNEADITASDGFAGGIEGRVNNSGSSDRIFACYNMGNVTAYERSGGILGNTSGETPIENCYNAGSVTGGIAGGIRAKSGSFSGDILSCYNTGEITGCDVSNTGAIAPGSFNSVDNCYYLNSGSEDINSGSVSVTAVELQEKTDALNNGGYPEIWKKVIGFKNDFPVLSWENATTVSDFEFNSSMVAESEFIWQKYEYDGETFGEITSYLQWTPIDGIDEYTIVLWKEYFSQIYNPEDSDYEDYEIVTERAGALHNITGQSYPELSGIVSEKALTFDLADAIEELGESRYYAVVIPEGMNEPDEDYIYDVTVTWGVPYNRMSPVSGLYWEGSKACWSPKPYFKHDNCYLLTLYNLNEQGEVISISERTVSGKYSKIDCSGMFSVGGRYAFSIKALSESADDRLKVMGYYDSPESERSDSYSNAGPINGVYVVNSTESSGDEHDADWIAITTAEQWIDIASTEDEYENPDDYTTSIQADVWSKNYYLKNDLDFSSLTAEYQTKTKSIGNVTNRFIGNLDGNGHKITGLTLSNSDSGLFWYIGAAGRVYDLTIEGANILVSDNAAVLAHNNFGLIQNCAVINSNITADTGASIGGMVSRNYGIIRDSYVEGGTLQSNSTTATGHGGFVGANERGGTIERCWTSMDVCTKSSYAGGFVGLGYGDSYLGQAVIRDCFALGNVTAANYSGGFAGRSVYDDNIYENCYAGGIVSVTGEHGHGFIGGNKPDSLFQYDQSQGIINCYYNSSSLADNSGAVGKTLEEMRTEEFVQSLNSEEEIWTRNNNINNGLPYIKNVKAPEVLEDTQISVNIALAAYDKKNYSFVQMSDAVTVTLSGKGNIRVSDVMDAAAEQGKLTYSYESTTSFGRYIHTINGYSVEPPDGWMFTINDNLSNISMSLATVKDGDNILWFEGTTENRFLPPKWDDLSSDILNWTEISNKEQLFTLAESQDDEVLCGNYKLTADLNLAGHDFSGIGSSEHPFVGKFDGQNHTVYNINLTGSSNVGFFNVIKGAEIKNLNLIDLNVRGITNVGGLAGLADAELDKSDMSNNIACLVGNCTVSGTVCGNTNVGGLIGINNGQYDRDTQFSISSSVDKCSAYVSISAEGVNSSKLGGLIGDNQGSITKSASFGEINAPDSNIVGGFVGRSYGGIYDCYSEGNVKAAGNTGGFAGISAGEVKRCYTLGNVYGSDNVGGFAGALAAADYVIAAGNVIASGAGKGGLAGSLSGRIVGTENIITVKEAFGNCTGGLKAIGNTSQYKSDAEADLLLEMGLDISETGRRLYEMFSVNMKVPDNLKFEADKYENSIFVPNSVAAGDTLIILKSGENASDTVKVTYEPADSRLIGGDKLTVGSLSESDSECKVTLVFTDSFGNNLRKAVTVIFNSNTADRNALMDAIAAVLVESSDSWTVMDMALYSSLPEKEYSTTEKARQNALNLLIGEAKSSTAGANDRARLEIVLRSLGIDSRKLYHVNSNTATDNAQKLSEMNLTSNGHYAAPWILLADMQGNTQLTDEQVDALITVLNDNVGDGLFGYEWDGVVYSDPDTACVALAALSKFYDIKPKAKNTVDTILNALPSAIDTAGSLGNANADAMAIIGLISMGYNPSDMKSVSGASLIDGLMSYVNESGDGFTYYGQNNALATEQGFRALIALAMYNGEDAVNIYDFSKFDVKPGRAVADGETSKPSDPVGENNITVKFTLKTDREVWIPLTSITLTEGSTVYHAFEKALSNAGITSVGASSGYVKSVTKNGVTLAEFDNGAESGWLYKVNGKSPNISLIDYQLKNGDSIVWYYTTDWTKSFPALSSSEEKEEQKKKDKPFDILVTPVKDKENKDAELFSIEIYTDGKLQKTVSEEVAVKIPCENSNEVNVPVIISDDGTETVVKKSFSDGKNVFAMINGSCMIKIINKSVSFKDIQSHWSKNYVSFAVSHELFYGTAEDVFSPDMPMSRAMLATVLYRIDDGEATGSNPFSDVPNDAWYTDAVIWASENELVMGNEKGFEPNREITREELAAIVYRYAKNADINTKTESSDILHEYKDSVNIDDWAFEAMKWAVENEILKGDSDTNIAPGRNASRAEVAAVIYRLIKLIVMQ